MKVTEVELLGQAFELSLALSSFKRQEVIQNQLLLAGKSEACPRLSVQLLNAALTYTYGP